MKIGIDIRTLMDKSYSGVPEYTLNLVREILAQDKKSRYKLFYNCFGRAKTPDFRSENVEIVKSDYPNKLFNYLLQKNLGFPKIDRLLGVDLFFLPHINFIALSGRARSVLTIHDLSFLRYPEFFSARKNFWHRMINVRKLAWRADRIVAVSDHTKTDIVELLGAPADKVETIYSGVSGQFKPLEGQEGKLPEIKNKYHLPDKYIFFLGTLEPRKNVAGLIKAYSELLDVDPGLADFGLVIAGGRGWHSDEIFAAWRASKYKDKIKFLGYVEAADKAYLYNLASVFVYPSFYEGFGFPPLEAMASGVPVVTSFSSSLPEVTGEAAILIDPYNINDIAWAIREILKNKSLADKLIAMGLARAKEFTWQKAAASYISLFNKLVG